MRLGTIGRLIPSEIIHKLIASYLLVDILQFEVMSPSFTGNLNSSS